MSQSTSKVDLKKAVEQAQLPALPQSAISLLELSQNPSNGPEEFAVPIESDPGLTGQVLRFVNSSYFGFSHEISNIKLAINLVGVRTIKNFALWSAVFSLMPDPKCGPFNLRILWRDSLYRGLFARVVGKQLGLKDAEEAFAAALLQDMAIPLLSKNMASVYTKLLDATASSHHRLSTLERKYFGWNHAEAGGMIARQWNLPEAFGILIEQHADLEKWTNDPHASEATLAVALSAFLPSGSCEFWTEMDQFCDYYQKIKKPEMPEVRELFKMVDKHFSEVAPVLKIGVEGTTLVEHYDTALEQKNEVPVLEKAVH